MVEEADIPTPEQLAEVLAGHERLDMPALPGRTNHLESAVLVPLSWEGRGVTCVVTVRAGHLRHHAGEVCFPGGRPEPADADLAETALREAREELGIEGARILGELSSIPLFTSDFRLYPFVAEVPPQELVPHDAEVARVLRLSLGEVLGQPRILAIPWSHEGLVGLSPLFEVDGTLMYGATAHAFYELLVVAAPLFGVELPPLEAGPYDWQDVLARERGT